MEARLKLMSSKKRKAVAVHVESASPDVVLPSAIEDKLHKAERASFVATAGPRKTIDELCLKLHSQGDMDRWCAQARVDALLGSCSRSLPSVKSGCRCYLAFAQRVLGKTQAQALPPLLDELLAWSGLFRCADTFSNYLGYVKVGTMLVGGCVAVFSDDSLRRAKRSIRNRDSFKRRERMFLQLDVVRNIVVACCTQPGNMRWGMLYLLAYVFLLRLPSEALPVVRGCVGSARNQEFASCIFLEDEHVCLKLKRRKNKPGGSLLKRACWCQQCEMTCPVHSLWPFFQRMKVGQPVFGGISAGSALKQLKHILTVLEVDNANSYRCHDLRRGHAKDMQMNGASLQQILAAGEWRSPSFLQYLDMVNLELGAVIEAHQAESSSEGE